MPEALPLLLLPGLLCDAVLWRHQLTNLADLVAATVADLSAADSMEALARSVLAEAPERFALAGLSMGGYVAFEIMRQAPERVTRLALLDTTARPDTAEQTERRKALIYLTQDGRFNQVMPRLLPMLIPPARRDDRALVETVVGMADRIGADAFVRQQTAIMHRSDSRPSLPAIGCPTLVLGGREDALTPPEVMAEIAAGIPGARHLIIDQCGHLSPLERPEEVTWLLRGWLLEG